MCYSHQKRNFINDHLSYAKIIAIVLTSDKADVQSIDGIRLSTMHRAKGLEFKAVAIPFMSAADFPPKAVFKSVVDDADREDKEAQMSSLLHVAATRAKAFLRVSWSGQPSSFLNHD